MKQSDKISIVVPIYNCEKYLPKCIDSILNQTYTNLEIILVNDGSKDSSQKICEEYAKKDKRIKLINKINGGPGSSKNTGIENATGKYIGFVDSDDYIDNDMFETLYNLISEYNADVSMIAFNKVINDKVIKAVNFSEEVVEFDKLDAIKELLLDREIKNYSWNKLFKKEVYEGIRFPEKLKYEDVDITVRLFEKINKLVYKKVPKYYYVQRNNSIVNCKSYNVLKDYITVTNKRYEYLKGKYEGFEKYNAMGFVVNMLIAYKNAVVYDIPELYKDFENNYELFKQLSEEYKNDCLCEFNNYKKVLFSIVLWDVNLGKEVVRALENQIEKNR